jgi:pimeloyl-ACP methyl ester carboxylesterase
VRAANCEAIRRGLFSADFPVELALRYRRLSELESFRANLELMVPQWFHVMGRPRLPALVLGGAEDHFVPAADLQLTSLQRNSELHVLDEVPHAMLLDTTWRLPAGIIADRRKRSFDRS